MARVMERDLLRQRLRERDPLLPDELLDVVGNMEDAVRRVATPLLVIPGEGPVAFRARGDELLPLEARLHHPLLDVVPELVERNVHRADFFAGAAAGALPGVPREIFSGFHLTAQQQVQRSAHLVLAEGEDATARRSAFPACLLIRRADRDTIAAHRARMDIFLNGRHLREARHSIPPIRSEVPRAVGPPGPPVPVRPARVPRGRPSRALPCVPPTRQTGSPTCVPPPRRSPTPSRA